MASRSCAVPWNRHTGTDGSHFWNSRIQLGSVARGATTMKGPETERVRRWAMSAITWMVLLMNEMNICVVMLESDVVGI